MIKWKKTSDKVISTFKRQNNNILASNQSETWHILNGRFDSIGHHSLIEVVNRIQLNGDKKLPPCVFIALTASSHGGGGPQVGEVTRLGGVTHLSI